MHEIVKELSQLNTITVVRKLLDVVSQIYRFSRMFISTVKLILWLIWIGHQAHLYFSLLDSSLGIKEIKGAIKGSVEKRAYPA